MSQEGGKRSSNGPACPAAPSPANGEGFQLRALAYDVGNFMRALALPKVAEPALTRLREADQHRGEGRQPRSLGDVPDGRGCRVQTDVPRNPVADRATSDAADVYIRGAMIDYGETNDGRIAS